VLFPPARRHSAVATATQCGGYNVVERDCFHASQRAKCVMRPRNKTQWPRRPPRFSRLFDNVRPFYFVTFNTYQRGRLLARSEVHEAFCVFCSKAREHYVAVGRYVIMPDHMHLFVAFPTEGIALPSWIQSLRNLIGKRLLQLGIPKPHWQEGFFDHLLRSHESYSQKWDYVRLNPVRARLCDKPDAWPYQGEIVQIPFD
jgi:putative transposase